MYQKAARYCSYQERTEKEVRDKLRALGVQDLAAEEALVQALKADRFLDEARYVAAFVRGKLALKQWGKRKIRAALTQKGLDPALVQAGLATIAAADYRQALQTVAARKRAQLPGIHLRQDQQKLTHYLLQKGYEPELVHEVVQALLPTP